MSFTTRVSTALYNDEKNNASLLKASVPLKSPAKVGQTVAVTANDLTLKYGAYVSVKTLKLYAPYQPNTVASNKPPATANAPLQAAPKNSRDELKSVIQPRLAQLGYYTGEVDGLFGPQTRRAIAAFENTTAGQNDGYLDATEIAALVEVTEPNRQVATDAKPGDADDGLEALAAENERLRLELENARLRQELEAAKQRVQQVPSEPAVASEQNAEAVAPVGGAITPASDQVATNFDGLYKPRGEQFTHWDCNSVGQDGGALGISGNQLTLIEESCTLTNPTRAAGSDEVGYSAQCAVEGTEYEAQVSLRKTDFGVVFSGDGFSAEWLSCEAVAEEYGVEQNGEATWVTQNMDCYLEVRREVVVDNQCVISYLSTDPSMVHFDAEGDNLSHINVSGDDLSAWNGGSGYRVTTSIGVMIAVGDDCYASDIAKVCFGSKTAADLAYERQKAEELAAEKAEAERLAAEKAEAERLAVEKAEAKRLAAEKAEAERLVIARAAEAERTRKQAIYYKVRENNRKSGQVSVQELTGAVSYSAMCSVKNVICENFDSKIKQLKSKSALPKCVDIADQWYATTNVLNSLNSTSTILSFQDIASGESVIFTVIKGANSGQPFDLSKFPTWNSPYRFLSVSGQRIDPLKSQDEIVVSGTTVNGEDHPMLYYRKGRDVMVDLVERNSVGAFELRFGKFGTKQDFCFGELKIGHKEFEIDGVRFIGK